MQCKRCGYERPDPPKSRRSEIPDLCSSCTAKPTKMVMTAYGKCRPHQGRFDDNDNPLKPNGQLYRPGRRLCGHRDCIAKTHIETIDPLEIERLENRSGKKLTPERLWKILESQRPSTDELKNTIDYED